MLYLRNRHARVPVRGSLVRSSLAVSWVWLFVSASAWAGVTNPQISIIGQPLAIFTDDPEDRDHERVRFDPGETEIVFDDYLNPYARGYFTLALGEEGMELEEGYFTIFRGLPLAISLRGGRYRAPFGRLNAVHPHGLPFAEPFAVLQAYLPGEEAFIETGVELTRRIGVWGESSAQLQVDWLQGNSFRIEREPTDDASDPLANGGDDGAALARPGFLARLSGFTMLGEQSALELGVTAAGGTNNVAARTRTQALGVDAKAKLWTSPRAYLLLQGEGLLLDREEAGWDSEAGYTTAHLRPAGGYVFADYNFQLRYNLGASFERFQEPSAEEPTRQSVGLFAGLALMEEATAIRLDWRRTSPEEGDAVQTVTLRVIYSMGPHKAHQF